LTNPEVRPFVDFDSAVNLQEIVLKSFERFKVSFNIGVGVLNHGPLKISEKRLELRKRRLELLNTSENNRCEMGFIKILP
jgi:predicted nucleotide-binding protein (sugar kinase/HSP70/actin superfamily)